MRPVVKIAILRVSGRLVLHLEVSATLPLRAGIVALYAAGFHYLHILDAIRAAAR